MALHLINCFISKDLIQKKKGWIYLSERNAAEVGG
jgi:hypothetical protein